MLSTSVSGGFNSKSSAQKAPGPLVGRTKSKRRMSSLSLVANWAQPSPGIPLRR
jgi:hypothetical protein